MCNLTPDRVFSPHSYRRTNLGLTLLFALIFGLALSPSVWATDGVAEINHTCAVQTGCFSGDAAGYPISIDGQAGGSYRLTSNLIIPDEFTSGIVLATSSISIDLNGFEIVRAGCEGATTNCTPASGGGSGINRTTSLNRGLSVKNGSITGMGSYGVLLGSQAEVTGLRVRWNGFSGINVGPGSTVSGNTAYGNGSDGITVGHGSTASGNAVYNNGARGISAGNGSNISKNTSYNSGSSGISAGSGSVVQGNTVRNSSGHGLNLSAQAAYRDNVITQNTAGTVTGGVNMLGNSCNGSTTCP